MDMSHDKSALAQSLRRMIDEADELLKSAAETGDEAYDAVRDQFAHQVRQMRDQLDDLEQAAVYRARRAARATDLAVREHPYGAMGIAAAVGLLIGFLAASRR
ncbi:YqjD family protein [Ideonella sp.]|uniref:DUF883 family protein n=1 Tax=Ideonella sp. TaxID=1929293 RepID=UPI0035AEE3F9